MEKNAVRGIPLVVTEAVLFRTMACTGRDQKGDFIARESPYLALSFGRILGEGLSDDQGIPHHFDYRVKITYPVTDLCAATIQSLLGKRLSADDLKDFIDNELIKTAKILIGKNCLGWCIEGAGTPLARRILPFIPGDCSDAEVRGYEDLYSYIKSIYEDESLFSRHWRSDKLLTSYKIEEPKRSLADDEPDEDDETQSLS